MNCINKIIFTIGLLLIPGLQNSFAQVVTMNGVYVSTGSGTVVKIDTLRTDNTSTNNNSGTQTILSFINAGTTQGNGTYNIANIFSSTGTFTAGSSLVNFNGNSNQNIPVLTYNNLTASGTGSTKTAGGILTVNGTLAITSGDTIDMVTNLLTGSISTITGTGTLKTQNTSSTPIPAGLTWSGPLYYNSSSAQTIVQGNYNDLNGTGGNRTLSSGITGIAGVLTKGSGTYTVGTSTINFNGSGTQNIPALNYYGLTISGENTKTLSGNISIAEALTVYANTTMALSNYNVTLLSDAGSTARVAEMPSSAVITYGTGRFIAQRYIMGRRKYRLMTSPVTTSTSSTLIAGEEAMSIWGNWQNAGDNGTAHAGTIITGGSGANGFDQQTTNASLYTYNDVGRSYTPYTTANSKNTKYTPLKAGIAYYMFVYGDRLNSVSTSAPNYTVLSSTGTILTGDQTYNTSSTIPLSNTTDRYTLLGNPFASPINWATIQRTNVYNTYWGWDPNLSSTGGYVTVSTTGTVTLISPFTGSTGLNQYIQSGQGFFVKTSAASPVLTIRESDKLSNYNVNAFTPTTPNTVPLMAFNLYYTVDGVKTLADGAVVAFDPRFSNEIGTEDASKMTGAAEVLSIGLNGELLSINARQMPKVTDTIFLKVSKLSKPEYTLQIFGSDLSNSGLKPFLEDTYLKNFTALSVTDTNNVVIKVDASKPASTDLNRFRLVFQYIQPAPEAISLATIAVVKIFPNPVTSGKIGFQLQNVEKGLYSVILVNSTGQLVRKTVIEQGDPTNIHSMSAEGLSAGTYNLLISNGKIAAKERLVILR